MTAAMLALALVPVAAQETALRLEATGRSALDAGDYSAAVEAFRSALSLNPSYLRAHHGMAEAYYWLGEYDQATRSVDAALRLSASDPEVLSLSGRIAIGRGDLAAATGAFESALGIEPNNVNATIGMAELALARGRGSEAAAQLERALRLNPEHRKALLSLVLVAEYEGDRGRAVEYLRVAAAAHRDAPEVHVLSAEYHLRAGDFPAAERSARMASALDPNNLAAMRLRARLAVLQNRAEEALAVTGELLTRDRRDPEAWYFRAVASLEIGNVMQAVQSIRTSLLIDPDSGHLRAWAEWLALSDLPLDDSVRAELSAYRARVAADFSASFRYARALSEYRRALQLTPLDPELRRTYAELHRSHGNAATYVREIEIALENGLDRSSAGAMEVVRDSLVRSVAVRWGVDQFTVRRDRLRLGLYLLDRPGSDVSPGSEAALLSFVSQSMQGRDSVEVVSASVRSQAEAYRTARSQGVDYFVLFEFIGGDRVTVLDGEVAVGRTGAAVTTVRSIRTGPYHFESAVDAFVADVDRLLPIYGSLVIRRGSAVVLDRGRRDGVEVGQAFVVVRRGAPLTAADRIGMIYDAAAELGSVTITAVDDLVSEGRLTVAGISDLVRVGDRALRESDAPAGSAPAGLVPVLYERIRQLR